MIAAVAGVLTFLTWDKCERFESPAEGSDDQRLALEVADAVGTSFLSHAMEAVHNSTSQVLQKNAVFLLGVIYSCGSPRNTEIWNRLV